MGFVSPFTLTLLAVASISQADELAWAEVSNDGSSDTKFLDVPVASARGAENLYIENPMDARDWMHTDIVQKSLLHWQLQSDDGAAGARAKVDEFQEQLRPIFTAMPKDAEGRLNNETARYALHRLFTQKHGWSIKGLEPSGGAWMATQSVTEAVKDINKYMIPSYIQQLFMKGKSHGYDLRSVAVLACVLDHMIHAEMLSIVYSVFTTLELSTAGKKTEKQVDDILDTFLMVYAFGINMEVSMLRDVQKTRAHLEATHAGWPQLKSFARDVQSSMSTGAELSFDEIVVLAEKIAQGYSQWQGKDCLRVKEELKAKSSYREGRVPLSDVKASHVTGRRSLLVEGFEDMEKLGVLSFGQNSEGLVLEGAQNDAQLIVPNYLNSQSMCLSTASMYTVCCANECDGLLSRLEREVAAATASPDQLKRLVATLPGSGIAEALLQELPQIGADASSGQIALHGRAFAGWMSRAFPLECPAPHTQKQTNPKTPDEWLGRSSAEVKVIFTMMGEIADVLARYTSMGKKGSPEAFTTEEPVSNPSDDVVASSIPVFMPPPQSQRGWVSTLFRFTAMASMVGIVAIAGKSAFQASDSSPQKAKWEGDFA